IPARGAGARPPPPPPGPGAEGARRGKAKRPGMSRLEEAPEGKGLAPPPLPPVPPQGARTPSNRALSKPIDEPPIPIHGAGSPPARTRTCPFGPAPRAPPPPPPPAEISSINACGSVLPGRLAPPVGGKKLGAMISSAAPPPANGSPTFHGSVPGGTPPLAPATGTVFSGARFVASPSRNSIVPPRP